MVLGEKWKRHSLWMGISVKRGRRRKIQFFYQDTGCTRGFLVQLPTCPGGRGGKYSPEITNEPKTIEARSLFNSYN